MKIRDYLSKAEVRYFTSKSDALAWRTVAVTWAGIIALFAMVDTWTNPLTIALALILLPGRQLGLAVITHECGHHTLFRTEALNRFVGQWLAANLVFTDMFNYASGHSQHHQLAGTREDPDLPNYQAYPVPAESFRRKVIRDLSGQTGFKLMRFILSRAAGFISTDRDRRHAARPYAQQLLLNLVFALLLAAMFQPWIYLLWIVAYLTIHMLVVRIRQVAEHAAVPDLYDPDPRRNTRTTVAPWWQRMIFAPNSVNYHLEHHFMASVPCYRLRELHRLLRSRGAYSDTRIFDGYGQVLRHAVA
jgi:fatty acid desaturase